MTQATENSNFNIMFMTSAVRAFVNLNRVGTNQPHLAKISVNSWSISSSQPFGLSPLELQLLGQFHCRIGFPHSSRTLWTYRINRHQREDDSLGNPKSLKSHLQSPPPNSERKVGKSPSRHGCITCSFTFCNQPQGLCSGGSSACYSSKPLPDSHAATNCLKCMGSHGHMELTFHVNQQDLSNHLHHKTGTESKHHKSRVSCLPTSIMHDANINHKVILRHPGLFSWPLFLQVQQPPSEASTLKA